MNFIGSIFKENSQKTDYDNKKLSVYSGSKAISSVCCFKCAIDCLKMSSSANWAIAYGCFLSHTVLFTVSIILMMDIALSIINRVGQLLS